MGAVFRTRKSLTRDTSFPNDILLFYYDMLDPLYLNKLKKQL